MSRTQAQFDRQYHQRYFIDSVSPPAAGSAPEIADGILEAFPGPAGIYRVVDVGCGAGDLLAEFQRRGLYCTGLERSTAAIELCRRKGLVVLPCNLETIAPDRLIRHDIAICMEVAEHLYETAADGVVALLCELALVVVFSAAHPGQGGNGHLNEQSQNYWIKRFDASGHRYDLLTTGILSARWRDSGNVSSWYWQNLMVFRGGGE